MLQNSMMKVALSTEIFVQISNEQKKRDTVALTDNTTFYTSIKTIFIDDYSKDGGSGKVRLLFSFYHDPFRT